MKNIKKLACVLAIISLTGCVPTGLQDETVEKYKKQYEQFEKKGPSVELSGSSKNLKLPGSSKNSKLPGSSKDSKPSKSSKDSKPSESSKDSNSNNSSKNTNKDSSKNPKKSFFQKIKEVLGFDSKSKQKLNNSKKDTSKIKISKKSKKENSKNSSKNTSNSKKKNVNSSKKENADKSKHDPYNVLVTSSVENGEQQIVYSISNNGKRSVAVDATIHFYDEANKEISNCKDSFLCLDSGESAVSFFKKEDVPDSFNDYKIKLSIHEVSVNSQKRNVIYSQSEDDSNASITGRNESSTVLSSAVFNIIYMMDSNPVFCTTVTLSDIQPGAVFSPTIPNIQEASSSDIEYNNCQIILKDAFSY